MTDKKTGVVYRRWQAPVPGAVLLLIHGLGAHSARWEFLADFFLARNISSYAVELSGFGETQGLRGHVDSFDVYYDDIRRLLRIIQEENPGTKVFLLGESMGALIAFMLAALEPDLFNGLICVSPAFLNRMKFSLLSYTAIFLSLLYNPKKQFNMPFNPEMCTSDEAYQKQMDSDSREHRLATSKLLFNIALAQARAGIVKNKIKTAVLFLLAGNDKLVDSRVSENIFNVLKIKDKAMFRYPNMLHALSIESGKEKVFEDILSWIFKRG
ncbi:MAG: alpha/beta fold hydrolase [Candidatus Omnitrophota bacterium]